MTSTPRVNEPRVNEPSATTQTARHASHAAGNSVGAPNAAATGQPGPQAARAYPAPSCAASIVVPVYNGAGVIARCLDALVEQTVGSDAWEVIVIADGSTDATPAVVERWIAEHPQVQARLVQQANAGPAAARNRGAEVANAPILLFTDADCAPTPDWTAQLLAVFDDPDIAGAKGVYLSDQTAVVARFVQAEYEDRYDRMADLPQIDAIDTYAAGYRRDVFLDNGGFDPTFVKAACEDHDLSFRLAQRGYRMVFAPQVQVHHLHVETLWGYMRRKYHVGFWKSLLTRRHPQRIVYDTHTPQTLKLQILLSGLLVAAIGLGLISIWLPALAFVWWVVGLALITFYLSASGFLAKLWRRSPALALAGLVLLQARALASGVGYLMGTLYFARMA